MLSLEKVLCLSIEIATQMLEEWSEVNEREMVSIEVTRSFPPPRVIDKYKVILEHIGCAFGCCVCVFIRHNGVKPCPVEACCRARLDCAPFILFYFIFEDSY